MPQHIKSIKVEEGRLVGKDAVLSLANGVKNEEVEAEKGVEECLVKDRKGGGKGQESDQKENKKKLTFRSKFGSTSVRFRFLFDFFRNHFLLTDPLVHLV